MLLLAMDTAEKCTVLILWQVNRSRRLRGYNLRFCMGIFGAKISGRFIEVISYFLATKDKHSSEQ